MWHPSAGVDGRGHLNDDPAGQARWLLIGNSRWHWAAGVPGSLRCWSEAPGERKPDDGLTGWAAVGPVPVPLPPERRLSTDGVPLGDLPAWLGVDRALGGWWAWRQSGDAVLVADAGTALSLTRVSADGRFAGGRLMAGAALQLRALGSCTAGLPGLALPVELPQQRWPSSTAEALAAGVLRGLAAAVATAAREVVGEAPHPRLWMTGGDGELLFPLVRELLVRELVEERTLEVELAPTLVLEALATLRPGPDR